MLMAVTRPGVSRTANGEVAPPERKICLDGAFTWNNTFPKVTVEASMVGV